MNIFYIVIGLRSCMSASRITSQYIESIIDKIPDCGQFVFLFYDYLENERDDRFRWITQILGLNLCRNSKFEDVENWKRGGWGSFGKKVLTARLMIFGMQIPWCSARGKKECQFVKNSALLTSRSKYLVVHNVYLPPDKHGVVEEPLGRGHEF